MRVIKNNVIQTIQIDKINIINPRERNQKIFYDITDNITKVGLKRPITVTKSFTNVDGYDLICGQGRLEAFLACGQTEIPAMVIEANEEEALLMSLVENLARPKRKINDLLQAVEILQRQGYSNQQIASKTGLSQGYIKDVFNLMARGEERLITSVEKGVIPISIAIAIAESVDDKEVLQDIYERNLLRGNKLLAAKKLIEIRKHRGKHLTRATSEAKSTKGLGKTSTQEVLKIYHKEVNRKKILTRKANIASERLSFIKTALKELLTEKAFKNILYTEQLVSFPKFLNDLLNAGD
jgi:ParB family chromosome partitioning protein